MKYWDEEKIRKYLEDKKAEVQALESALYLLDLERKIKSPNNSKRFIPDYIIEDDDGEIG